MRNEHLLEEVSRQLIFSDYVELGLIGTIDGERKLIDKTFPGALNHDVVFSYFHLLTNPILFISLDISSYVVICFFIDFLRANEVQIRVTVSL